jgi:hypothetical protein
MRRDKCGILVPSRDGIDHGVEKALHELARRGYRLMIMRGVTSIDQIRSQMATDALKAGFEELFWIDDDVLFDPDDVDRLREHDMPIVGGVYPWKGKPQLAVRWLDGTKSVELGVGGGIVEVKYAATGFLLTRAEVYATIRRTTFCTPGQPAHCREVIGQFDRMMYPFFQPMVVDQPSGSSDDVPRYLAEDWAFFHRAREAGFKVHVDTRIRLYHVGRYAYSWEDLEPRERIDSAVVHFD